MQTPAKFGEREKEGGREIERERGRERAECRKHTMYIHQMDRQTGRERERESGMPQAHNVYL